MNTLIKLTQSYDDNPKNSDNYVLGSLQLIAWLIFKPSNWKKYVTQLPLSINKPIALFCLAELNFSDLKQKEFRKLIIKGLILLPFIFSGLAVIVIYSIIHFLGILTFELADIWAMLSGALGFSLATAWAFAAVSSIAAGIVAAVAFAVAGALVFFDIDSFNYISVAALCFAAGIVSNITLSLTEKSLSFQNNLGGGLLSLVAGLLFAILSIYIALFLQVIHINIAISFFIVIALSVILFSKQKFNQLYFLPGLLIAILVVVFFEQNEYPYLVNLARGLLYGSLLVAYFALPYALILWLNQPQLSDDVQLYTGIGAFFGTITTCIVWAILGSLLNSETWNIDELSNETGLILGGGLLGTALGLTFSTWRAWLFIPITLLWDAFIFRLDRILWKGNSKQTSRIVWHVAFWDEHQHAILKDLRPHLLWVAEQSKTEAEYAIRSLKQRHEYWKRIAESVQIEIEAKHLTNYQTLSDIRQIYIPFSHKTLSPSPWLQEFVDYSRKINDCFEYSSTYDQIACLYQIAQDINLAMQKWGFGSTTPNAMMFYAVAESWYQVLTQHIKLLQDSADKNWEIPSPYLYALPLKPGHLLFKGREQDIKLIKSLLLGGNSIFLHGQYRIGKTSLLKNLPLFLPAKVLPLFIDLQGVVCIADANNFFYQMGKQMQKSAKALNPPVKLPDLDKVKAMAEPKEYFQDWLELIKENYPDRKLVLLCDEFAKLYEIVKNDKHPLCTTDVYGTFRYWMQHLEVQFIIASQFYESFKGAGDLVNSIRYIHLSYLPAKSARELIEKPINNFPLSYEDQSIEDILLLTRQQPALLQLVCRELISLKNTQDLDQRFLVNSDDVQAVIPICLEKGMSIFITFENKLSETGQSLLRYLATFSEGFSKQTLLDKNLSEEQADNLLAQLKQLELIEKMPEGNLYQFQIALFRHYFLQG